MRVDAYTKNATDDSSASYSSSMMTPPAPCFRAATLPSRYFLSLVTLCACFGATRLTTHAGRLPLGSACTTKAIFDPPPSASVSGAT